ncbi:hypothetical protein [Leuconostoc sp. S50]|uniref:hypothetical protein n=1 Tax=Leuconostoc sp. S50 TaxID=2767461 RepID=UPI001F2377B0|nr:hypothetical protein [Leuconostoc sp. S50]
MRQHSTAQHSTAQHSTAQHSTANYVAGVLFVNYLKAFLLTLNRISKDAFVVSSKTVA